MSRARANTGYIPSLDGWRAIAILGVLMTHDRPWVIGRFSNAAWQGYGGRGVYLFFAISGFLICTRVLEDEVRLGSFRLKAFYVRRFFRIQPAAWMYLAAIALLIAAGIDHDSWSSWRGALLLYTNFLHNTNDPAADGYLTTHFWTLAVEEHFYFLLSLLIFFVKRRRVVVFSAIFFAVVLLKRWIYASGFYNDATMSRQTQMMVGFLLFPALLALLLREPRVLTFAKRWLRPWVAYGATACVMVLFGLREFGWHGMLHPLTHPVDTINTVLFGCAFWVIATALHPRSWSTQLLEWAPLRFVGRLSYSIYLWHVLLFTTPARGVTLWISERPYRYLGTVALSLASYYLVEKPMIRLGHRIAPPATPGHADLRMPPVTLADDDQADGAIAEAIA